MKSLWVVATLLFGILVGCGGGGGGGGSTHSASPIGLNESVNGSLTTASIVAPDGTYVNLYTIDIATTAEVSLRLESIDFDTILGIFDDQTLGIADLNAWDPHLIADNDDIGPGDSNSALTVQLPPGKYVIVVNSFDLATGAYTLTTSTNLLTLSMQYVQYRTLENSVGDSFRAWIDYKNNGALLQPGDLLTARLYDPLAIELTPAALQFVSGAYTVAAWDPTLAEFGAIATDGDSGFYFDLSNYADLTAGTYTFEVDTAAGTTLSSSLNFPVKTILTPVSATSMTATWNLDGSLSLAWTEPADTFDQYRVVLVDTNGNALFYGRALPGISQVTLQPSLIAQIGSLSQVPSSSSVQWTMQTRNYSGNSNVARGISSPVPITWP